jgi:hypothetical protein
MKSIVLLLILFGLAACGSAGYLVDENASTDYSQEKYWAALPTKEDPSDLVPDGLPIPTQTEVDVFFLYPTSFLSRKDREKWNASLDDKKVNNHTDQTSIKYQASVFNQVGQVYAPRYRQAHIHAYYSQDKQRAMRAFDLAYRDVRDAFQYYLTYYNKGRPIIIAGHSQGTTHGMRLVREFFDGTPLQNRLVTAYLAGMPIPQGYFEHLQPCNSPEEINCINSWRTFKYGYEPRYLASEKPAIITNPISWKTDTTYIPKTNHKGAVLRKFDGGGLTGITDAQIYKNILWVHKPKFPGSFLYRSNNFHIADYNFFYFDIRQNALLRKDRFLNKTN